MKRLEKLVTEARQIRKAGRPGEALARLISELDGPDAAVAEEAALAADALGRRDDAIRWLDRALTLAPDRVSAWINLSAIHAEAGDLAAAAHAARSAAALAPTFVPAWVNLGSALAQGGDYAGAIDAYTRAIALEPSSLHLRIDLASALFACGEVAAAIHQLVAVLKADPKDLRARSLYLLALHHATNDPTGLAKEHAEFGRSLAAVRVAGAPANPRNGSPLRVAMVSGDFRRHSVWYFLAPLLSRLPAHGIELHCFHTDRTSDDITTVWRAAATRFVDAGRMSDEALAASIRGSDPDLLLNLGGHTTAGKPDFFLRRVAPVQASYLGYPGPIGSPNVDYWIADERVAPIGEPDTAVWGAIARLPDSYFCYEPMGTVEASSLLGSEPVVFGSFNVLAKISAVTIRLWSAVLHAVPTATLLIKNGGARGPTRQRLTREFASLGIATERVHWIEWTASRDDHLEWYRKVDVALDTFPYNGATTTCEALWMGVPVVSLAGRTPASRMGRSILHAAECSAWVFDDPTAYVDCAVRLAAQVEQLRRERNAFRERVLSTALCNPDAFARNFATLMKTLSAPTQGA
jgi:predicted O-linked N-acetylglucosamine transferase (SPINDLY family)